MCIIFLRNVCIESKIYAVIYVVIRKDNKIKKNIYSNNLMLSIKINSHENSFF